MTPNDIMLVRASFRRIAPIADQAAGLFYARLFELDPALRIRFRGDMLAQGRKLMSMIATAVASLHALDAFLPAIRKMGRRHARLGIAEEHYGTFGAALLWTLQKGLGAEFTPAVREAWTSAYSIIANTMIDAQRELTVTH